VSDVPTRHLPAKAGAGFTLLEVLAAVMILGLWYMVIAAMAMDGLRAEGRSIRLLAAAQLADRALAEVEASAMANVAPEAAEPMILEDEGDFTVVLHVTDFGSATYSDIDADIDSNSDTNDLAQGDAAEPDVALLGGLIAERLPDLSSLIRKVVVRVHWNEGLERREIRRTTHLFDETAAIALYQESGLGGPAGELAEGELAEGEVPGDRTERNEERRRARGRARGRPPK
jgi:prepilin-type N-terminal cleavage/methylation domain-containing protein